MNCPRPEATHDHKNTWWLGLFKNFAYLLSCPPHFFLLFKPKVNVCSEKMGWNATCPLPWSPCHVINFLSLPFTIYSSLYLAYSGEWPGWPMKPRSVSLGPKTSVITIVKAFPLQKWEHQVGCDSLEWWWSDSSFPVTTVLTVDYGCCICW
jgi:hypothetical protein